MDPDTLLRAAEVTIVGVLITAAVVMVGVGLIRETYSPETYSSYETRKCMVIAKKADLAGFHVQVKDGRQTWWLIYDRPSKYKVGDVVEIDFPTYNYLEA